MCLAIPGKVVSIKNELAVVDFKGIRKKVNIALVDIQKGDWVLVHVGFAIEKVDEIIAKQTYKLLEGII
ncbi:MAG: HypC/HybG/HupF family hydrogenase formation chaperone [Nanoarchaeota archaeon]|nr:HypC/HybG/HupF family hydrogenase formation chaperone [Nanoarchaeota archaeon]